MQLRNIRPFSQYQPGDTAEVPDGAEFDPFHWEAVLPGADLETDEAGAKIAALKDRLDELAAKQVPAAPRLPYPAKEM